MTANSGRMPGNQSTAVKPRAVAGLHVCSGIIMAMTVRWMIECSWVMAGRMGCDTERISLSLSVGG